MKNQPWSEIIPVVLWHIVIFVPVLFILRRTGKSPWWLAPCFVPFVGLVVTLYVVAFSRWPKENASR